MEGNPDPHSASNLTINQCVTLKLKDDNYLLWKLQFEQFLASQMLLGYVDGSKPRPAQTMTVRQGDQAVEAANPEFQQWILYIAGHKFNLLVRSETGFCLPIINEAEYRCLSDTAAELSWISDVLKELGFPAQKPAEAFCDNLSAVHLTANPVLHKKSKHFATHYHYAREQVAKGTLVVHHVSASSQLADIFTKSLPQAAYFLLRSKLGVVSSPTMSLRGSINSVQKQSMKTAQQHQQKPITEPTLKLNRDKGAVAVSATNRTQGCSLTSTQKERLQLHNRYGLLTVESS